MYIYDSYKQRVKRSPERLQTHLKNMLHNKAGKTKYMEIGRHRGMIANEHIRIGSNSYEKVKTLKYLGSLVTNQNSIYEEIKSKHYCLLNFFLRILKLKYIKQ